MRPEPSRGFVGRAGRRTSWRRRTIGSCSSTTWLRSRPRWRRCVVRPRFNSAVMRAYLPDPAGGQDALFDPVAAAPAGSGDELVRAFAAQRDRIADVPDPGRFRLLVAAE